jgi:hypothetical protein
VFAPWPRRKGPFRLYAQWIEDLCSSSERSSFEEKTTNDKESYFVRTGFNRDGYRFAESAGTTR